MSITQNTSITADVTESSTKQITIDMLMAAMENWRANKKKLNEKIPDNIWDGIFSLITTPESQVLKLLGISQSQFIREQLDRKTGHIPAVTTHEELAGSSITQMTASNRAPNRLGDGLADAVPHKSDIEFSEVKPPAYPLLGSSAKAFSTQTCVVELYRPDGILMKIHMCTDRFDELLTAFAKGNGDVKC